MSVRLQDLPAFQVTCRPVEWFQDDFLRQHAELAFFFEQSASAVPASHCAEAGGANLSKTACQSLHHMMLADVRRRAVLGLESPRPGWPW